MDLGVEGGGKKNVGPLQGLPSDIGFDRSFVSGICF